MDLLIKIMNTYKINRPSIKEMEGYAITIGCDVKYNHDIFQRWFRWVFGLDCEYVLTRLVGDDRNYTA